MTTSDYTSEIPYGYCKCGCGQKTPIAKFTDTHHNRIKGEPAQFIRGHHGRIIATKQSLYFWSKVAITADDNQCWLWLAGCTEGYGRTTWNGRKERTHRVAWIYPDYIIPDDMEICHSCDNPSCCNPKHLFLGTHQDNMDDMVAKGRSISLNGEKNGQHKLSEDQVKAIRSRYASGGITHQKLANEYNVSRTQITDIIAGKNWKHLTP